MAKAKVKVKKNPKAKPKTQTPEKSNRMLIGRTKVRTIAHLRFNADGEPRRKGW